MPGPSLWEGRYRAAPIDSEAYFLACCRTIELNPVRAGMVDHPRAYRWSSYRAHADGAADALLSEHAVYRALISALFAAQSELLDPEVMRPGTALRRSSSACEGAQAAGDCWQGWYRTWIFV
jgi:hypothetical protein